MLGVVDDAVDLAAHGVDLVDEPVDGLGLIEAREDEEFLLSQWFENGDVGALFGCGADGDGAEELEIGSDGVADKELQFAVWSGDGQSACRSRTAVSTLSQCSP